MLVLLSYFLDINGALLYYQIDGVYLVHSHTYSDNILINNWLKLKQQNETEKEL